MSRPPVDVVVPFRGDRSELQAVCRRFSSLTLREGDTIVVVDNTPGVVNESSEAVRVMQASQRSTPGYARNRGAELGENEWIVFLDADTQPPADLLDRYFEPPPAPDTVLLAGGVIDEPVPVSAPAAARYAYLRGTLNQARTLELGEWGYAQTANVACRRSAFEAIDGFEESIRAGEDADLSLRLKAAGGRIEAHERAAVVHLSRRTLRTLVQQAALHGAGSAWIHRRYPALFPARRRPGLIWWAVRFFVSSALRALRARNRDELVRGFYEPIWELAFEFGRSRRVEPPEIESSDRG